MYLEVLTRMELYGYCFDIKKDCIVVLTYLLSNLFASCYFQHSDSSLLRDVFVSKDLVIYVRLPTRSAVEFNGTTIAVFEK